MYVSFICWPLSANGVECVERCGCWSPHYDVSDERTSSPQVNHCVSPQVRVISQCALCTCYIPLNG